MKGGAISLMSSAHFYSWEVVINCCNYNKRKGARAREMFPKMQEKRFRKLKSFAVVLSAMNFIGFSSSCFGCCPHDPAQNKQQKMDGWTFVRPVVI